MTSSLLIDCADDTDAFDDPTLNAVLMAIGWRSERSTIEGRRRVFDEWGLLVNVYTSVECWEEIRLRGLENGRKS